MGLSLVDETEDLGIEFVRVGFHPVPGGREFGIEIALGNP